jgi:hypothetical protein
MRCNHLAKKGTDALAGDWGRTNEEPGLALASDHDGLSLLGWGPKLDKHDRSCGRRSRNHRMHDNAQLAVVGVGLVRVKVRYLRNGK